MNPSTSTPSSNVPSFIKPFMVHFLYNGEPSGLLVLAKTPRHAVKLMFRYFETFYHSIDMITYDRTSKECYVKPLFYFSDTLYKHYNNQDYGNI